MHGVGTKLLTTGNSRASAHLLDVTRTASRVQKQATGIDRVERAYLDHLIRCETPLLGLVRTRLGYLLLDRDGCAALQGQCSQLSWRNRDILSRMTRRHDSARGILETGLRRIALDRATPSRLKAMLQRHVPDGAVYLNVGQNNYTDRVIDAVKGCTSSKSVVYVHDTIPLDLPDTQTAKSRGKFDRFLKRADRFADMILCNSETTRRDILRHSQITQAADIHVIPPGVIDPQCGIAPEGLWTGNPYFLAIGTIEPRKNIRFLLDLWFDISGPDAPHLVICGSRGWLNGDVHRDLDAKPANIHELANLPDAALWALLKDSNGLLFPSLAEGFGYPAFEAAQLGVPVICNPLPVFKELLKDYPIYAGESDRYSWRKKIEQLAQRRRGQSGEQSRQKTAHIPRWESHFNRLFTLL